MSSYFRVTQQKTHLHVVYSGPPLETLSNGQRKKIAFLLENNPSTAIHLKRLPKSALLPPSKRQKITHTEEDPSSLSLINMPVDVYYIILKELDPESFMTCARISTLWNKTVKSLCTSMSPVDLQKICPMLTLIDAELMKKKLKLEILEEPPIDTFEVIKGVRDLAPHVTDDLGLTLLTVTSENYIDESHAGLSIAQLRIHSSSFPDKLRIQKAAIKTHRILITNCILKNSQNTTILQKELLLQSHRCTMPSSDKYVVLCSRTYDLFGKLLYRAEKDQRGLSSTTVLYNGKSINAVVAFFTITNKSSLQTHTCTYLHKDKVGVGALRTFPTLAQRKA